jgi:hypothetical protein
VAVGRFKFVFGLEIFAFLASWREKLWEEVMKRLWIASALIILGAGTVLVWASNNSSGAGGGTSASGGVAPMRKPNSHEVFMNIRKQQRQIHRDLKAGKITEAQAKDQWEKLKIVRQKQQDYLKQNGSGDLNESQKAELKNSLGQTNTNSAL